jgi:hypothetical protein
MKTLIAAIIVIIAINFAAAQVMEVPIEQQYLLFMKILSFDKNLKDRAGSEIVVGIFYQKNFKISIDVKDDLMSAFNKSTNNYIMNIPVKMVPIDIDEVIDLAAAVKKYSITVFYITPLRAARLGHIIDLARSQQIRTLTGMPEYVVSGLAIGIGSKGGKPLIIVNLLAAKAEGANYNSQLLKLARIVG